MILIDTHCHIYSTDFEADREAAIARSLTAAVSPILMPAIDRSTHALMLEVERNHPADCLCMMGLHPCSVKEDFEDELSFIRDQLRSRPFKAIGESGLDFYWDKTFTAQQYEAFRRQLGWALEYDLPIVIHSRSSTDECIELVREFQDGRLKGVFHCFSGTVGQAQQITALGFCMGIGGVLTFRNAGLDKVLTQIPLDNIVLETDAPYLAPMPYRGKRNEPAYLALIAQKLADLKQVSLESIASITTANAQKLFGL